MHVGGTKNSETSRQTFKGENGGIDQKEKAGKVIKVSKSLGFSFDSL